GLAAAVTPAPAPGGDGGAPAAARAPGPAPAPAGLRADSRSRDGSSRRTGASWTTPPRGAPAAPRRRGPSPAPTGRRRSAGTGGGRASIALRPRAGGVSLGSEPHRLPPPGPAMTADGEPKSLSEITRDMGLNMSDVAAFSGLDESTIFRLWDNTGWLDRVSGRSLQSLMSSVPGIAEYSMAHAIRKRRDVLVNDLHG